MFLFSYLKKRPFDKDTRRWCDCQTGYQPKQPLWRTARSVSCAWKRNHLSPLLYSFRYSCQVGYHLEPPEYALRRCGTLGHWAGMDPICRREYVTIWEPLLLSYLRGNCRTLLPDQRTLRDSNYSFSYSLWIPRAANKWSNDWAIILVWRRSPLFVRSW